MIGIKIRNVLKFRIEWAPLNFKSRCLWKPRNCKNLGGQSIVGHPVVTENYAKMEMVIFTTRKSRRTKNE